MSTYQKEQIDAHLKKMSPPLKDALFAVEVAEKIHEIGVTHGLLREEIGDMAEEIGYVMLGLTRPNQFLSAFQDRLDMDEDQARDVAKDIYHQIFSPIRQALKDAYQVDIGEEALQEKAEDIEEKRAEKLAQETERIARMPQDETIAEFSSTADFLQKALLFKHIAEKGWMAGLAPEEVQKGFAVAARQNLTQEILKRAPHYADPQYVPSYMEGKGATDKEKAVYQVLRMMSIEEKLALPDDALNSSEVTRALWLTASQKDLSAIGRENYAIMSAMNVYADNLDENEMNRLEKEMEPERVHELDAYFQTNIAQGLGFKIGWHRPKKWIPPK